MTFTLYHNDNSVCSQKARIALNEKGVTDWESRELHLFRGDQFDPEYLKLNPKGVVPTLVHDGRVQVESTLIAEYLDDVVADNPLKPADPYERAQMRLYSKACDEGLHQGVGVLSYAAAFVDHLRAMSEEEFAAHLTRVPDLDRRDRQTAIYHHGLEAPHIRRAAAAYELGFAKIEKALKDGRTWLMGDQYTLAEVNLTPYLARLDDMNLLEIWTGERPDVTAWYDRIRARPSFDAEITAWVKEEHLEHFGTGGKRIAPQIAALRDEYLATDPATRMV